ncbi:hypothetical protein L3X38_000908 [Prunus dulcis]|uniref:Uncharacterized protein n=1 Tax=Prunus dulcis TaxID=3755 RepID=A0AAD4ZJQ4_PRUDU|nr:hypothetical protein L3X38_000908 [Prunus dulcis]
MAIFARNFAGSDLPPPAAISGDQDRAIVSDPTVRSEPNLQDKCPIPYRTHRNFRIGGWRSWSPWARLTTVRVVRLLVDRLAWRRLSGVETDPIRGVGCTGVWGDYVEYREMK